MSGPVLECEGVERSFKDGSRVLKVLDGVSLKVGQGEIVGISGNSGSGKTTLLNIMGLLDEPTEGVVRYQGDDTGQLGANARARIRNSFAGFIFQEFFLIKEFNVIENVMIPAQCSETVITWFTQKKDRIERAKTLLASVDLKDRSSSDIRNLSGGEKQRVAIARALMNDPGIVFCDEPTGNLDEDTAGEIKDLFIKLNHEQGTTFIVVSHNMSLLEICTSRLHLTHGLLEQQ